MKAIKNRHKSTKAQRHKGWVAAALSFSLLVTSRALAGDWTNFLGDASHKAYTTEQILTPLTLKWKAFANGEIVSSPVKYKDKVFIGSRDKKIHAFHAYTGQIVWSYQTQGWVDATPAVSPTTGTVYAGSYDGTLYALDENSGALKWKYTTSANIASSALVYQGKVYFGTVQAGNNKLVALDEATGALAFSVPLPQPVYSSPAADSGKIFVGCNDGKLYALDADTGNTIWTFSSNNGQMFFASPSASSGTVFISPGYFDPHFYALDAATGAVKWSYNTGAVNFVYTSSQAVSDTAVYFSSGYPNGTLFALDVTNGSLKWSKALGAVTDHGFLSTPAVSGNVVYAATGTTQTLYALDAQTGNEIANYALDKPALSSIAATNGMVYAATTQGSIYAYYGQDSALPTAQITSPANNSFVSTTVAITGSATDTNLEYYMIEYKEDGDADWEVPELVKNYLDVANGTLYTWNTTALIENQKYDIQLSAYDVAGNTESAQISVTVDRIAPALTVTAPADGLKTSANALTTTGTTEPGTNFTINNEAVSLDGNGNFTKDYTLSEGANSFTYVSRDAAGNTTTVMRAATLDTTPPALTVTSPIDKLLTNVQTLSVTGKTESGASAQVNGIAVTVDGDGNFSASITLSTGANTVTVSSSDTLNNATTQTFTVTYDPDAPGITITSPPDNFITNSAQITVSGSTEAGAKVTVNSATVSTDASGNFTTTLTLAEGTNTITVIAEDAAGNKMVSTRTVTLDTAAPSLMVTSPEDNFVTNKRDLTVSGTCEAGSTLTINNEAVTVATDGSFSTTVALAEGENTITLTARDSAQNEQTVTRKGVLDTQPPTGTIAITPPSAYTDKQDISLSLSAKDNDGGTGVKSMILSEDSAFSDAGYEDYAETRAFTLSASYGQKTIYGKFKDAAGNESEAVSASIEYVMFISPSVNVTSGATLGDNKTMKIILQDIDVSGTLQLILSEAQPVSKPQNSIGKAIKLRFVYTAAQKASGGNAKVKTMVTLLFPYGEYKTAETNENALRIYYTAGGGDFKQMSGFQEVDMAAQTVKASSPLMFNVDYTFMLAESETNDGTAPSLAVRNYPNPVHGDTTFSYSLSHGIPARVTIDIYNVAGKKVLFLEDPTPQDGMLTTNVVDSLPNGVYIYKIQVYLETKTLSATGRLVMLR